MYNTKNYTEQGGETTRFGGKVVFEEGCEVEGLSANPLQPATAGALGGVKIGTGLTVTAEGLLSVSAPLTPAANQAASTATDVAGLKADLNTLLSALKTAGLMAADAG